MEKQYENISKKQTIIWLILRIPAFILFTLLHFILRYFVNSDQIEGFTAELSICLNIIAIFFLSILGIYAFLMPFLQQKFWQYRICDDKIEIRYGVIAKSLHVMPVARIQQITVIRSIINRIFGLSTIIVETAGSQKSIIALDKDIAENLAIMLNQRVNILAKDKPEAGNI